MATTTPNYHLRKPTNNDTVNVATDISGNMDLLDAHLHSGTYASVPTPGTAATAVVLVPAATGVAATDTAVLLAAVTSGAKEVILSAGTYVLNLAPLPSNSNAYCAAYIPDGVWLRGQGKGATTLRLANNQTSPSGAVLMLEDTSTTDRAQVSDLTIDCGTQYNPATSNVTTTVSSANDGTHVLTVASTAGFAASGFLFDTTQSLSASYTGKTGTTFTGCSSLAGFTAADTIRSEGLPIKGISFFGGQGHRVRNIEVFHARGVASQGNSEGFAVAVGNAWDTRVEDTNVFGVNYVLSGTATSGSAVVTSASAAAGHVGMNFKHPAFASGLGSHVISVVAGVSWTISHKAVSSATSTVVLSEGCGGIQIGNCAGFVVARCLVDQGGQTQGFAGFESSSGVWDACIAQRCAGNGFGMEECTDILISHPIAGGETPGVMFAGNPLNSLGAAANLGNYGNGIMIASCARVVIDNPLCAGNGLAGEFTFADAGISFRNYAALGANVAVVVRGGLVTGGYKGVRFVEDALTNTQWGVDLGDLRIVGTASTPITLPNNVGGVTGQNLEATGVMLSYPAATGALTYVAGIPSSTADIRNPLPFPVWVHIIGGNVQGVFIKSQSSSAARADTGQASGYGATSSLRVYLKALDYMSLTYDVAPTDLKFVRA